MAIRVAYLSLFLGLVLAGDVKSLARIRRAPSPYVNSSTPIDARTTTPVVSTTLVPSPTFIDNHEPSTADVTAGLTAQTSSSISADKNDPPSTTTISRDMSRNSTVAPSDEASTTMTSQFIPTVISGTPTSCVDTVMTYYGSLPAFSTITITEEYTTTVFPNNTLSSQPTQWVTPPQACSTTVNMAPPHALSPPITTLFATFVSGERTMTSFLPTPMTGKPSALVVITKKTAVVVTTTPSGVNWPGPDGDNEQPASAVSLPAQLSQGVNGGEPGSPNTDVPNTESGPTTQDDVSGPGATISPASNPAADDPAVSRPAANGQAGNDNPSLTPLENVGGVASIIASVLNSPFVPANAPAQTTNFLPVPATPTIAGVAFTVGPSNIVVGSQTIVLPPPAGTTVTEGSQTFTIRPSEIVGSGTTYQMQDQLAGPTITQAPSVVTTAGVILTIGPSRAVISGTTYRIGVGAVQTTISINGQTIVIGNDGVAFGGASPTTFTPAMTIANGREVVVVDGTTVYVDQTAAVISGTAFRIGSGATSTTIDIGGRTITLGPNGIVFPSTTIRPVHVPSLTSIMVTSSSRPPQSAQSGEAVPQNSGLALKPNHLSCTFLWLAILLLPLPF